MKHSWQDYANPAESTAQRFIAEPERRCANCGAIQRRSPETAWMRIVRIRWLPLVGRCSQQDPTP